jgi:hypothetical protein
VKRTSDSWFMKVHDLVLSPCSPFHTAGLLKRSVENKAKYDQDRLDK